ncbi:O-acetylserine dependent cystathionine beta-synthase [Alkalicoccobacillus murimartini]|uniref:O-acetylserine dependent cystathionine beta-synthase n=1 Tax=Alkalicoccobacillus murimartini TaxID=171685 RepID=A0ABT9YKR5_9BACI|nr:O-acetylserine dependent cystathionine beta-synthase [Alkalicoccobacillus murimartini]
MIGWTPIVEIRYVPLPNRVRVLAKLEYLNPGGSVKDRLGAYLLKHALNEKHISPKGNIIEPTAGNTGIGLALAAVGTDITVYCIVPEGFSLEKQQMMRALGAKVIQTPRSLGMQGAIDYAHSLSQKLPDSYCPEQFSNTANPLTYYETLAPELWSQVDGEIDIFVAGAGTGGTFTGTAKYLKEKNAAIRTVIVEPEGSILNGGKPGPHRTEGIGMDRVSPIIQTDLFDGIHTIQDKDAFQIVRELARKEGLLVGSSSGAAFQAAVREAKSAPEGTTVVTIFPDGSERYLSTGIYEEEKDEKEN